MAIYRYQRHLPGETSADPPKILLVSDGSSPSLGWPLSNDWTPPEQINAVATES
jgi:hypothetical protein